MNKILNAEERLTDLLRENLEREGVPADIIEHMMAMHEEDPVGFCPEADGPFSLRALEWAEKTGNALELWERFYRSIGETPPPELYRNQGKDLTLQDE